MRGGVFHIGTGAGGSGILRLGGRGQSSPTQAHVLRMKAVDSTGRYFLSSDYTASLTQAGKFVDAFGSSFTYDSPNVLASPTRMADATSGMVYARLDGGDDTAICSAPEIVAAYTALVRFPASTFGTGGILDMAINNNQGGIGYFIGGTGFHQDAGTDRPRAVRKNGVLLSSAYADLSPITQWMVLTVLCGSPTTPATTGLFQLVNSLFLPGDLAELRTWPADPTSAVLSATESEIMSFYSQQYGLSFS